MIFLPPYFYAILTPVSVRASEDLGTAYKPLFGTLYVTYVAALTEVGSFMKEGRNKLLRYIFRSLDNRGRLLNHYFFVRWVIPVSRSVVRILASLALPGD